MMTLPLRLAVMLTVWVTLFGSSTCLAQPATTLPSANYFLGFSEFFDGEYLDAERTFRRNQPVGLSNWSEPVSGFNLLLDDAGRVLLPHG